MDTRLSTPERLDALRVSMFAPGNDPSGFLDGWHEQAVAAQRAALAATLAAEWLDAGTAPLLVVQGLDDALAPPANGREMKARLGERVRLVEIAGAGHAMLPEQPAAIAAALVAFFTEGS
jgi:pimeloyl-ACP methyl ester carboxylesterase